MKSLELIKIIEVDGWYELEVVTITSNILPKRDWLQYLIPKRIYQQAL